jgi:uncharacterized protein YycO
MQDNVIRLRFVALETPVYRLATPIIQWYTGGWVSHVDALTLDNRLVGAAPFGGVSNRAITSHPGRDEIIEVPCTIEQRREFWEFMNSQIGKSYDWIGLLGFPFSIQDRKRWFCSEIIAAGLHNVGIINSPKPHKHSPVSLYEMLRNKQV